MYQGKTVLALIPARGSSTRIPNKNLRRVGGKTLVRRAVETARRSRLTDRVIVSTDSEKIAAAARAVGAEIPFLRPKKLALPTSPTIATILHALAYLEENERFIPDIVVIVQPTSPFVAPSDIDAAIRMLVDAGANSCVSMCEVSERPEWMFIRRGRAFVRREKGALFRRSQDLTPLYRLNGAVNATLARVIKQKRVPYDEKRLVALVMPRERSIDIDYPEDLRIARALA